MRVVVSDPGAVRRRNLLSAQVEANIYARSESEATGLHAALSTSDVKAVVSGAQGWAALTVDSFQVLLVSPNDAASTPRPVEPANFSGVETQCFSEAVPVASACPSSPLCLPFPSPRHRVCQLVAIHPSPPAQGCWGGAAAC